MISYELIFGPSTFSLAHLEKRVRRAVSVVSKGQVAVYVATLPLILTIYGRYSRRGGARTGHAGGQNPNGAGRPVRGAGLPGKG